MGPGVLQLYGLGRYKPIHRAETLTLVVYRFRVLNRNRPRPVLAGWRLLADEIAKQKDKNHDKNLLDRTGGNTKLGKTNKSAGGVYRVAGLSLMPSDTLCPARLLAECAKACLESAGRGRMQNVIDGRQRKADWFASDPESFLAQLTA